MSESEMKKQAFLIGINQYAVLPELEYARQDAEAVEQALKQNYNFSDNEVILMTDAKSGVFKPFNKRVIQSQLEKFANQELDLFIFGFWGRSLFQNGERYLCPLDVMNDDVEESGFSFKELQRLLSNIKAKNTCLILDCSQTIHDSHGELETLIIADQTNMENAALNIGLLRKVKYPEFASNVAILSSCKLGQRSCKCNKLQRSIFTAHLLDAMNKQYESVAKIFGYVSANVEKSAMDQGKIQTPIYKLEGEIPLLIQEESTQSDAKDVFISYRHCNANLVKPVEDELVRRGISYFIDRDGVEDGMDYPVVISDAIKACKALLFFWTSDAINSRDMLREAKMALDLGKRVLPYKIGTFDICEHGALHYIFGLTTRYDVSVQTSETVIEIVNRVQKALADKGTKPVKLEMGSLFQAAEQGDVKAQLILGDCYFKGWGVAEDKTKAVYWYRKAAEQGDTEAQFNLGNCYYNGVGVDVDLAEAVKWYRIAAEQGDAWAQSMLGTCYEYGIGTDVDMAKAVKWYRTAAEKGHATAQYNLGCCYFNGYESYDKAEAAKWFRLAAKQGHAKAQYNLGICYEFGLGVAKNILEAVDWYCKSAERGNENAIEKIAEFNNIINNGNPDSLWA